MTGRASAFENVTITLQHDIDEQYQYQPNEIIRGKIGINLHRRTLVKSVYISIIGEGFCSWEDNENDRPLQSGENYINATQVIFDTGGSGEYLDKGFHEFPFEYCLPDSIPSSFIGKYGSVTYILKAVAQGERTGDTSIATEPFLVMRCSPIPEALNKQTDFRMTKKYFSMCSWGKLQANVHLNKTGFVPGEDINIEADIQNQSPLRVLATQASLIMISDYHAQKNVITFRQVVNKMREEVELLRGDRRRLQNVRIGIPPYIPESCLTCCDIINVSYMFQFKIDISGGKELKTEIPITMGSNPRSLEMAPDHKTVNIHWTMGPRDLVNLQQQEQADMQKKWTIEAPEFRQNNMSISNPLFRNDNQQLNNGDKPQEKMLYNAFKMDDIAVEIQPDTKL